MKIRVLFWLLVPALAGILSYFASTGQLRRAWLSVVQGQPEIHYPAKLNLGGHEIGEVVVAPFTIANRGRSELVIDQVRTNCSCTGMEQVRDGHYVRVESLRLQRGEEIQLVMHVSVRGVPPGAEMVNVVEFHTNDPSQPTGHIEAIIGPVSRGVSTNPGSVVFGSAPVGRKVLRVLDVRDTAMLPRRVERVTSTNPARVTARFLPVKNSPEGGQAHPDGVLCGQVEVCVDTSSPGEVNEALHIFLAGETRNPDAVAVIGKVTSPFEMSPSLIVLPRASGAGALYHATCVCRSTNAEPFTLSVESVPPGIAAMVLPGKSPHVCTIRITLDPRRSTRPPPGQPITARFRAKAGISETMLELRVLLQTEGAGA
jgi:hypothetical protein